MLPALHTFHSVSRSIFSPIRSLSLILKNFSDETDSEFYSYKKANNNSDSHSAQMGKQSLRISRSKLLKEKMPFLSYQTCRYLRYRSKTYSIQFSCKKLILMRKTSFQKYSLSMRYLETETQVRSYTTKSVSETLIEWENKLKAASVPEPRLSAEHIIAHILGVPRKDLNVLGQSRLSGDVASEMERLMTCRLARMPVQYIVGNWDFHSVTIKLRPPVFIPRPETEQLVDLALRCLNGIGRPRVLDIGCGSGAISLALLKNISDLRCVALDQSRHAIELTEENATSLGVLQRLTLVHQKVTVDKEPHLPYDTFDLIVSNPPYVLRKDLMNVQPEIMIYEDMRALDGGKEGLDMIKPILLQFQHLLSAGKYLILEVDPCHQYLIPAWMAKQKDMKLKLLEIIEDFQGKVRFLKFVKSS
ncbi:MTRF1L release factor glutamine methyltransferase-like isoform X2 [Macrobrachium rosenbergii]|uniref:MTRF1L release factor glutamine methyltransferase-like isoform X2 n=1 Tax=Macrobrachium rosenbergii TaxID=79674 RepID=UPI0034D4F1AF